MRRCAFRFTDGSALEMYSHGMLVEESYFFHIDWTAADLNGLMTTIQLGGRGNVVRRNTMHRLGTSSALNPGDAALIEYNDISDTGHLQSDGALSHMMVGQQPGAEIRYNWSGALLLEPRRAQTATAAASRIEGLTRCPRPMAPSQAA